MCSALVIGFIVCVCVCDITEAENSGDEEPGLEYLQKELGPVCCLVVCVFVMCVYLCIFCICLCVYFVYHCTVHSPSSPPYVIAMATRRARASRTSTIRQKMTSLLKRTTPLRVVKTKMKTKKDARPASDRVLTQSLNNSPLTVTHRHNLSPCSFFHHHYFHKLLCFVTCILAPCSGTCKAPLPPSVHL